ncbi:hypothetical protein LTR91_009315 [Friedmanniomyces endolithicus]|uniref:Ams2/SPT21 N-terminal domain-containing protein n=1 Tax=Friedmanniomyces endolithicus TaxID=329885 RepID=A0AAN6JDI8_9PEZI|nr:hypothetical protein LTR35_003721 [Friedmanniomyces endolithicus]KAK0289874.1 hypothetical protein LTS00_009011 [Friedmanniomyces endolithicus]KAK0326155.1 hypothetical protein LTR82_002900 [Friedmanniomyces endolithicus]KAK0925584.1 hypothetical protein LTR57_004885 [Friedmanniomyces endolithicus]KAK0989162.1 hypothetical protein LTR91_009315 [Friedmanniomyces endolithicus]
MDTDTSSTESGYADVPTRPMRVKVLYSFDEDNKTNCLARLPNTLQIPAVAINDTAQVGVIDLQQCIHAVTSASPELISRLSEGDYTVYAYDYSEEDTPSVGQGMLSSALAAATAGADSEKAMITGRVCKNMQALFSNGVKETLEVKLRLVPVRRSAISAAAKSSSPATTAGFDPNAWNSSQQQNRLQQQMSSYFDLDPSRMESQNDLGLVDEMFGLGSGGTGVASGPQMMGGAGIAETPTDPTYGYNPAFSHSPPGSRAGSPMMGPESNTFNEHLRHQSFSVNAPNFADHSRPGSRASVRSEVHSSRHQRQPSTQSLPHHELQSQPDIYYNEDGQSRKRAKVIQTDWHGRSSFGPRSGDLRVTAATAHSMHMHRPIAKRSGAPGADLEPPPRAPTPVPAMNPMLRQQRISQPAASRSFLRQASTFTADSDFLSDADQFSDAMMSSPDDASPNNSLGADGTPQDIPSSPPVLMGGSYAEPSSPRLPVFPSARPPDSGYMSEPRLNDDRFVNGFEYDDENRSPDAMDHEIAAQYHARVSTVRPSARKDDAIPQLPPSYTSDLLTSDMNVNLERPGDMTQLPQKMLYSAGAGRYRPGVQRPRQLELKSFNGHNPGQSTQPATVIGMQSQTVRPASTSSRRSSLALPAHVLPPPSTEQNLPTTEGPPQQPKAKRKYTKRARTVTAASDAGSPAPSDTEGCKSKRSGSGVPRGQKIQERLETAVANNKMPEFCSHCGAIETPTWRKLYVRYFTGSPSPLDSCEGEGETVAVESVTQDPATNEITQYLIRKSIKRGKAFPPGDGFNSVTVCNPCGLWFNKFRCMRPEEKWAYTTFKRRSRQSQQPGGTSGDGPVTDGAEPQSDAFFYTDQAGPEDVADQVGGGDIAQGGRPPATTQTQRSAPTRPRANSLQPVVRRRSGGGMNASQLDAALTRAVQSSPPFRGSQHSPIEISDITPRPTRRLLFPSPRRDGEVKSLDDNGQASLNATPPSGKGSGSNTLSSLKGGTSAEDTNFNVFDAFLLDKENMEPGLDLDDDLMHLFQGSPTAMFKTPRKTPTKTGTTPRSPQTHLDDLLKPTTPSSRKRKPLSPNPNAANNPTASTNDFMTSPSSSRYFLRSTPSRQDRTPARASQTAVAALNDMTPFSRHIAQMLTEATESVDNGGGAAALSTPSRALDFGDLPTFSTPGKNLVEMDWSGVEEMLSSEFAAFEGGDGGGDGGAAGS